MSTVGIEFPIELARCQALLQTYHDLGPPGTFAAASIEVVVELAKEAWRSQDPVEIVKAFALMKECE